MIFVINRKASVPIQFLLIFAWLSCLASERDFIPIYLLVGVLGVFCLWQNYGIVARGKLRRIILSAVSVLLAGVIVVVNLAVFEPLKTLLSLSNILLVLLGSYFAVYQILIWLAFSRRHVCWKQFGQIVLVFLWMVCLIPTGSRFCVYIFCGLAGILCICSGTDCAKPEIRTRKVLAFFAGLFSLAVALANYPLFEPITRLFSLVSCAFCLAGGFLVGYHALRVMMNHLPVEVPRESGKFPQWVFFLTWVVVSAIYLLYLIFGCYPGLLTQDTITTVEQILGIQPYNNTMPFWHTVTVQPFLRLGLALSGNVEGGIALFHCVQALFMAMCFAYVLVTLYQIGVPKIAMAVVFFVYACLPYNIAYSVSLWKDVPFSGAALLFVTGLFRLIRNVGKNRKLNYGALIFGAIGFSLWRTNGWYAFLVMTLVMALLLGKKYRKLLVMLILVLLVCWILINPVLDSLGVTETNLVEAFAVPMQQVARVVAKDRPLTEEQRELLDSIFVMDIVADLYDPESVDPIKFQAFRLHRVDWITKNPGAYLRLYFQLGIQYPSDYLKAWVDETKGYWNGGYEYWMYELREGNGTENPVGRLYASAFRFLNETEALKLFTSIGLYVWGMIACCLINVLKRREEFLLAIPSLVLVVGLWLGSPVFCEFRYGYPVLLTLPMIACVTMYQKSE